MSCGCVNCGESVMIIKNSNYNKKVGCKKHSYHRCSLDRIVLKNTVLREVLADLFEYEVITPLSNSSAPFEERCLCTYCYTVVEKIERRRLDITLKLKEIEVFKEEFLTRSTPQSYLSFKKRETVNDNEKKTNDGDIEKKKNDTLIDKKKDDIEEKKNDTDMKKKQKKTCRPNLPSSKPTIVGAVIGPPSAKRPKIDISAENGLERGKDMIRRRHTDKKKAITLINRSHYVQAFKLLLTKDGAKQQFSTLVKSMLKREVSKFTRITEFSSKTLTNESSIETFNWGEFLEQTRTGMPLFYSLLEASITPWRNSNNKLENVKVDPDDEIGPLGHGLGLALAILLRLRRPKKFTLIPSLFSVRLFRQNYSQQLLAALYKLGLCMSIPATKKLITKFNRTQKTPDTEEKTNNVETEGEGEESNNVETEGEGEESNNVETEGQGEESNNVETADATMSKIDSCTDVDSTMLTTDSCTEDASQSEEAVMEVTEETVSVDGKTLVVWHC